MKMLTVILPAVLSAGLAAAQDTNTVYVIRITNQYKERSHRVVSLAEVQALRVDMMARNRLMNRAVDLARTAWKGQQGTSGRTFPAGVASAGDIESVGLFAARQSADQTLAELNAEEERRQQDAGRLSPLEKEIAQLREKLDWFRNHPDARLMNQRQRQDMTTQFSSRLKLLEAEQAERHAKESALQADLAAARQLYEAKLGELLARQPPTP